MNRWWPRIGVTILLGLPAAVTAQGDEAPATLRILEDRDITIVPSQAQPASLEEVRANYRELLKLTQDPDQRNAILRRLADVELAIATRALDPAQPARRALTIYQDLLSVRTYREREADLLYRAAHAADLAGDTAAGIVALTRLIDNYPDFKLIPEARFRRGETRFVVGNYRLAEQDYSWLISNAKESPFYLQALYKRGWTNYKLGDYRQALNDQLAVLRLLVDEQAITTEGTLDLSGLPQAEGELAADALRNMTLDFVLLGDAYTPGQFTQATNSQAFEYVFTKSLFDYYLEDERYTDASQLATTFAQSNPTHPKAKQLEVASIEALVSGGFDVAALEAKQQYVTRYGLNHESWYGKDPLLVPEVSKRLKIYLDQITRSLHAGAQNTDLAVDYLAAADWYAKYLEVFPQSPRAPELMFLRADTLFAAEHYAAAASAYETVAYEMPANERAGEAAYAALLAWRAAAGPQVAGDPKVRAATLRFAKQFPAHEQAAPALAKLTEELFNSGDLAGAGDVATLLIEHQPPPAPEQLANAWRVRAAAAMQANDYAAAEAALGWLIAHVPGQTLAENQTRLATVIYRQGEALAAAGKDEAAAAEFLRLRELIPAGAATEIRAKALYDAAAAQIRAENQAQAIALLESFRNEYPQNELAAETTRKLAELHLAAGHTAAAAREFARVREQSQLDMATRREAARQAAVLNAEAGNVQAAIAAYETYLNDYNPGFEAAMEAYDKLVTMNQQAGNPGAADDWRQRLIAAEAGAGPASTERSRTLAASAVLKLAEDEREAFAAYPLTLPLQRSLPTKQERFKTALAAYGEAAEYGIAGVTTAATYYTGDLYYDFGRALLTSPRPRELSGDELAQYEVLLEEQAFPFEQQAISIHQANVERIANGLYNEWIKKSLAQLAKLVPARYARNERLGDGIVSLQ